MSFQLRRPLIITALLLLAFVWGYRRDEVVNDLSKIWSRSESTAPDPAAVQPPAAASPLNSAAPVPSAAAPGLNSNIAPGAYLPPGSPGYPAAGQPGSAPPPGWSIPPYGAAKSPPPGSSGVPPVNGGGISTAGNPTGGLPNPAAYPLPPGSQPRQPNMAQTLESITPGSVQENQIAQRNLYFEKLSQQLKELQGEQPPVQPPMPPPGAEPSADSAVKAGQPESLIPAGPSGDQTPQIGAVVPNNENMIIENPYNQMPGDNRLLPPNDNGQMDNQYPTVDPANEEPDDEDPEADSSEE